MAHVADTLSKVTSSDANRQRVRGTLRSALNDAVRQQLIPNEPCRAGEAAVGQGTQGAGVDLGAGAQVAGDRDTTVPGDGVDPAQLGALLDAAEGDRLYSLFHLIAHRGLRRGEAIGLAWTDVDLDAGQLTVRRQRVQVGWDVIEGDPKSTAGGRTIALDRGTVNALRAHRRAQLEDRMAWASAWVDSGHSPGRTGRRCTPSS